MQIKHKVFPSLDTTKHGVKCQGQEGHLEVLLSYVHEIERSLLRPTSVHSNLNIYCGNHCHNNYIHRPKLKEFGICVNLLRNQEMNHGKAKHNMLQPQNATFIQ